MVGLVLLGMVMGGVVYAELNWAYPDHSGNYGYFNGNHFEDAPEAIQLGYVMGVYDALRTVYEESEYISKSDTNSFVGDETWATFDTSKKLSTANSQALFKVWMAAYTPDGVVSGQLADVARAYVGDHPTERQNNAALLVWRALAEADWN